jgi:hypothetical protein
MKEFTYKNKALDRFVAGTGVPNTEQELRIFMLYLVKHRPKTFIDACSHVLTASKREELSPFQLKIGTLGQTNKIMAIKELRAVEGLSLKEAKDEVERLAALLED